MNMSYCRHQNTLTDLRDCANDLEERCNGDAEEMLSREEFEALVQIAVQARRILRTIQQHGEHDTDQELTDNQIYDTLAVIDEHACDLNDED